MNIKIHEKGIRKTFMLPYFEIDEEIFIVKNEKPSPLTVENVTRLIDQFTQVLEQKVLFPDNLIEIGLSNIIKLFLIADKKLVDSYFNHFLRKYIELNKVGLGTNFKYRIFLMYLITGKYIDCRHINLNRSISDRLRVIIQSQFELIVEEEIQKCLVEKRVLSGLVDKFSLHQVFKVIFNNKSLADDYFSYLAKQYTIKREEITYEKFCRDIFGCQLISTKRLKSSDMKDELNGYYDMLLDYVREEYEYQREYFIKSNLESMNFKDDFWVIYRLKGASLHNDKFDFSGFESSLMKQEVKLFIKDQIQTQKKGVREHLNQLKYCSNFFASRYGTKSFLDIRENEADALIIYLEHERKLAPETMRKAKEVCGRLIDYINKINKWNTNKEEINYFKNISFHRISDMSEPTDVISENVFEQLREHKHELHDDEQLMFEILENTGLRAKEVELLEDSCVQDTEWPEYKILKYIPHKIRKKYRKKSMSETNEVLIPAELAVKIDKQKEESKEIRIEYKSPYIFLKKTKKRATTPTIKPIGSFNRSLNILIKKHNMLDDDGNIANITSRMYRKTLIMTMIENGATRQEIVYALGHFDSRTSQKYYDEVDNKHLADLNAEFYKNKFEIFVGEDNLKMYSEEERRVLYVDFCMETRKVELGYCSKHMSEGVCGKRSGKSSCANCNKLCTGKKYLIEWQKLRDDRQKAVNELERIYINEGIAPDIYKNFREYEIEMHFLMVYNDIIQKIIENL